MKGRDTLCASQASTAVCSGLQDRPSVIRLGRKSIDKSNSKPSSSSSSSSYFSSRDIPISPRFLYEKIRKSSADIRDWASTKRSELGRRSFTSSNDRSPSSSSRQLLSNLPPLKLNPSSEKKLPRSLIPISLTPRPRKKPDFDDYARNSSSRPRADSSLPTGFLSQESGRRTSSYIPSRKPSSPAIPTEITTANSTDQPSTHCQVVVLKVSIHCKGCEGKVRRHISKMQGVRSFSIDLEAKKVTVVGDVTPSDVLESISKVKKAQLWPPSLISSSSSRWSTS